MRPIDQKLKYQIDKLVKTAATGSVGMLLFFYTMYICTYNL